MTVADNPQSLTLAAPGPTGFRMDTPPGRSVVASPEGAFRSLLFQEQPTAPESHSSVVSSSPEYLRNGRAAGVETIAKKSLLSALLLASVEPGTTPKRKKASAETDTGAVALASQSPDMSKAARWILSLTNCEAPATCPPPSSVSVPAAQPLTALSEQAAAATSLPLEDEALAAPELSLEVTANRDGAAKVKAGVTPDTIDAAPFAELSLTPSANPTAASRLTTPKSDPTPTPPQASSCTRLPESAEARPQSAGAIESPDRPTVPLTEFGQEGDSSLDSSSDRETLVPAATNKKAESGGAQGDSFKVLSDPRVSDQLAVPATSAPGAQESERVRNSSEPQTTASSVPEPAVAATPKPAGSSVGTIELQIKSPDQSSVGLRFVERQGRVEIQMKSGDQQTARALSENLGGLKTSLNETGWDVESRIQPRIAPVGRSSQSAVTTDRGIVPTAEYHSTNLSNRFFFDSSPPTVDRSSSSPLHPMEQVSNAQMSRPSGSDPSASQDQSRHDRNDTSGRNGQQGRNDNTSSDSRGQGRRSARDSEAWLESMESNLTRSSLARVTTGVPQ